MKLSFILPFLLLTVQYLAAERPNIVIVMADDLGWGDPQCYQPSSKIPTPAMNRLAEEGVRFTDAHSPSSVCSPTRYGLLTGRYAWRTRMKSGVLDGFDPPLIEKDGDTLASLLKRVGYKTHCIGKWHLGLEWTAKDGSTIWDRDISKGFRPGFDVDFSKPFRGGPIERGFDTFFGIAASLDMSPYCFLRNDRVVEIPSKQTADNRDGLFMNQVPGVTPEDFELGDVLPRIASEAAKIIRDSENDPIPFFCYVPFSAPHLPVVPTPESIGKSEAGSYGDFVVATDNALGEILKALDETNQAENTLVLFTSDNGGLFHYWDFRASDDGGDAPKTKRGEMIRRYNHQSNANWRGTKADIYEGGHRVPFLARWPGRSLPGRTIDATIELTDVFATISEIVGESSSGDSGMDSLSIFPIITGSNKVVRPFAVHHSLRGLFALRRGDWKLVEGRGSGGFTDPKTIQESAPTGQLYNLKLDPQETTNLYNNESEKVVELGSILQSVRESGGADTATKLALSPESTAINAATPNGFSIDVIASEPTVSQPISFAWDHLGRLWVAECNTYSDRSLNYDLTQSDRIVVLSDEDNNGSFETRTVFADNLQRLTSVAVGFGGVWALTSPTMVFFPDVDGDLVPDGPAKIKLDGFDLKTTRHTIVNGLKWGPDGWLYGRHGIQSTSVVGKPGTPQSDRTRINTGIWRYHPQREKVELWTEGGTNPWGHDWNSEGDLFYINTVIGHLWQGIPGGFTKRMYGQHERPFLYRLLDMHADHWHFDINGDWKITRENVDAEDAFGGGHAHTGLMIYQADKWPEQYRGDLYALNFHGRRVNRESLHQEGSGWVAKHKPDFVKFPDPWFRAVDIMQGPDGDAYILDWSDTGECHDNDAIHRGSGRVYRIRYGEVTTGPKSIPETFEQLDAWLRHPNVWYARQARLLIQEINAINLLSKKWVAGLQDRFKNEKDEMLALRYLTALHAAGVSKPETLLRDPRESIRVQAIHLLREKETVSVTELPGLVEAARNDSARVRLAIVSLLPKLDLESRLSVAEYLLAYTEDDEDHNYPLMLWYNIEPIVANAEEVSIKRLLTSCRIPEIRRFIIRRLGENYETNKGLISRLLLGSPEDINTHIAGLADALEGVPKALPPPQWKAISKMAADSPYVNQLGAIFGDGRALTSLIEIVDDSTADPNARRSAIRNLATSNLPNLKSHLLRWIEQDQLAGISAQALARFPDVEVGRKMLERFGNMMPAEQDTTIDVLVSRAEWAGLLLDKVAERRFAPDILNSIQARQIVALGDRSLTKRLSRLWGDINPLGADAANSELEKKIRTLITADSLRKADTSAGRALFSQRCGSCHQLYGEGSILGPDLTGSGRNELDYLLENILHPNAVVPAGYKLSTVKLKDGRTLSGSISAQTDKRISLNLVGAQKPMLLANSEIEAIETSSQSLMPAGLLNDLSNEQLPDFFAYMMGDHQAPLKE
ncbi:MAG: sulfatase-like hydrolase/transferase [Verrucomicrobia bacterium]|nr:sulfatase-like hydrolase/transferase [Verrucomicrobiota bacterium]MDA1069273.1 sulfatase-like hydrolase/transferase [Verrucomicrobiota bacterium]